MGRTIKLRFISGKYINEFLSTIFHSLESNFSAVFNGSGVLSDYDLFGTSSIPHPQITHARTHAREEAHRCGQQT
jgi:hypothetical protein